MLKQGNGKSVVHNKPEYFMMEILLILYTSPYHIYKTVLIAKSELIEISLTEYT